jgi:serine/threonine protein kinase
MAADPLTPAPERYGRYRLLERIGKGGMAEVFRASVDGLEGFRDAFVIKRIRPEKSDSAEFIEMFVNEARICALLHHANIVEVYDFGQIGGAYFMAMEYLRGRDLAAVMRALRLRLRAVPPFVAARVAEQIALGLHHAHGASLADGRPAEIVHRDVTPSNIMLLGAGGVKVLDFGIAKAAEMARAPELQKKGRVKGKLAYLSPEQVRGAELDGRSDVFSLGVVLWEMLVGQRLFASDNEFLTMRNVLTMPVPPPSSKRAEVPAAFDAVVLRALARDREQRHPSARAFADALSSVLRDAPAGASVGDASVRALLAELFGEGASEPTMRATATISAASVSSLETAPSGGGSGETKPVGPGNADGGSWTHGPVGSRSLRGARAVVAGVALVVLVGVGLAFAAWRLAVSRAAPDPSRRADTANAGK